METLNLFGLPMDESGSFDASAASKDLQAAIKELVYKAITDDPQGSYKDYSTRKSYAAYDPYSDQTYFASLKYEDEAKLRASIVINVQSNALHHLRVNKDSLSMVDRERLE